MGVVKMMGQSVDEQVQRVRKKMENEYKQYKRDKLLYSVIKKPASMYIYLRSMTEVEARLKDIEKYVKDKPDRILSNRVILLSYDDMNVYKKQYKKKYGIKSYHYLPCDYYSIVKCIVLSLNNNNIRYFNSPAEICYMK